MMTNTTPSYLQTHPHNLSSLFTETMLDPTTQLPPNHFQTFKPTRHATDDHHTSPNMSFENRAKTESNENHINWNIGQVQFSAKHDQEDESGVVSPPLWKSSPPRDHHPPGNNYRYLSPNSRAQAIARGQRELMEMVKHMPESCYELSLKDLVEHNRLGSQSQEEEEKCLVDLKSFEVDEKVKVIKRQGSKVGDNRGKMMRSTSHDNGGLLLKMVLPFSLGSKKKKKSTNDSPCAKVSLKPDQKADQASEKSWKGVDKEWWKKRFSVSSESESGVFSSNSGSSGSSRGSSRRSNSNSHRRSGCSPGCWFFLSKRSKRSTE